MPIDVESLLQPISGENPSGVDLRYDALTDQIKEARRQDDAFSQGVWKRDLKTADYAQVIKLGTQALTKRSKDLQIAAWMAEALLRREGFSGFRQGLELVRQLLDRYWETLYPPVDEDGDMQMRATPMMWIASQLGPAVRSAPITQAGHSWYQYRESRTIPTEDEARMDGSKMERRNEAMAEGGIPPEEFERGVEATPVAYSQKIYDLLSEILQFVQDFNSFCDEKFGEASPDFGPLRTALEEVQQTSRMLLIKKGGLQTPAPQPEPVPELVEEVAYSQSSETSYAGAAAAPAPVAAQRRVRGGIEPSDFDDAVERLQAIARYLRREFPFVPMAYLIPRAMRWSEIRATGGYPDGAFLEPPPSEVRIELKRLANENNWTELREKAEEAAAMPCGRAWLDVQRYAVNACRFSGADMPAQAIVSELKAMLTDFPQMTQWTLADDTPAANAETMQWLQDNGVLPGAASEPVQAAPIPPPQPAWIPPVQERVVQQTVDGEELPPDAYDLAMDAARSGRPEEALSILSREIAQERSGRSRFLRKIQLAQVCLATGNDAIGRPILEELAEEIEARRLDGWEGSEMIAQPLALLYQSLANASEADEERRKLYARICRLDPARALSLAR